MVSVSCCYHAKKNSFLNSFFFSEAKDIKNNWARFLGYNIPPSHVLLSNFLFFHPHLESLARKSEKINPIKMSGSAGRQVSSLRLCCSRPFYWLPFALPGISSTKTTYKEVEGRVVSVIIQPFNTPHFFLPLNSLIPVASQQRQLKHGSLTGRSKPCWIVSSSQSARYCCLFFRIFRRFDL